MIGVTKLQAKAVQHLHAQVVLMRIENNTEQREGFFFCSFTRASNATLPTQQVLVLVVPPVVELVEDGPSGSTRRPSCSPNSARTMDARVKMMQQHTRPVRTLPLEAADKDPSIETVSKMILMDLKNTK